MASIPGPPAVPSPGNILAISDTVAETHADAHTLLKNAARMPATTGGVQFAVGAGDDADDGLSHGSAKQSILAAYDALPSTGGIIYLGPNARVGGEVPGQGIRLTGRSTNLATGWRTSKSVHFVGTGTNSQGGHNAVTRVLPAGGSTTAWIEPWLWIAESKNVALRFSGLWANMGTGHKYGADMWNRERALNANFASGVSAVTVTSGISAAQVGTTPFPARLIGVDGLNENVTVSSISILAGVITFNLAAPTANAYASGSTLAWQYADTAGGTNCASVTFEGCYFESAVSGYNAYKGSKNFWIDFIDCSFTADSTVTDPTSSDRWSVVLDDCYLQNFLNKTTLTYGGILASTAISFSQFQNIAGESFSTGISGTIDQPMISLVSPSKVNVGYIQGYDSTGAHTAPMVKVRPLNWNPANVFVQNIGQRNANAIPLDGPATIIYAPAGPAATVDPVDQPPWQFGAVGFSGDRLLGMHMAHRRSGGPQGVNDLNLIDPLATNWINAGTISSSPIITGKTDPFGNTNAGYIRSANTAPNAAGTNLTQPVATISRTFAAGDIILFGCWVRVATLAADVSPSADAVSTKFTLPNSGLYPVQVSIVDAATSPYAASTNAVLRDWTSNVIGWQASAKGNNGDWYWAHGYGYVASIAGGGGAYLQMAFSRIATQKMLVAYPVLLHLTGVSEAEARMRLEAMQAYSSAAPVGSLGMPIAPMHVPTYPAGLVPTPTSGMVGPFIDAADGLLKFRNSSGTLKTVTLT